MTDQTPDMRWTVRSDDPIVLLAYADGTVRVEHRCDRTASGRGIYTVAPALRIGDGHELRQDALGPTLTPSILCLDCGLHGFVTNGEWEDC